MVKKLWSVALLVLLSALALSACAPRAAVELSSAPTSPYFKLTALPGAAEKIEQTVDRIGAAQQAAEAQAQAAEAAQTAAPATESATESAAGQDLAAGDSSVSAGTASSEGSSGYDYSYGSGTAVTDGQSEDQCFEPVFRD